MGTTPLRLHAIVKFRQPLTVEETAERFRVLELRGPRVLVEGVTTAAGDFSSWRLKPTWVFVAADLEEVAEATAEGPR